MKKLLSVLMVAVMLVALAVPALAAEADNQSPGVEPEPVVTLDSAVDAEGNPVDVEVSVPAMDQAEVEAAVDEAIAASGLTTEDAESVNADVFDIDWSAEEGDFPVTVVVTRDSVGDVLAVMYYDEATSEWSKADFKDLGDGKLQITFEHFCTVVVLTNADVEPITPPADKDDTSTSDSKEPTSPKTGYD